MAIFRPLSSFVYILVKHFIIYTLYNSAIHISSIWTITYIFWVYNCPINSTLCSLSPDRPPSLLHVIPAETQPDPDTHTDTHTHTGTHRHRHTHAHI